MKFLGTLMYIAGILLAAFTGIILVTILILAGADPEGLGWGGGIAVFFVLGSTLGVPSFLLIFFGRKLARKNAAAAAQHYQQQTFQQPHQQPFQQPGQQAFQQQPGGQAFQQPGQQSFEQPFQKMFDDFFQDPFQQSKSQPQQTNQQQSYTKMHKQTEVTVRYLSDDGTGNAGAGVAGGAAAASGMAEKLVQCKNCGAHKTVQPRQSAACEYCGTALTY